MITDELKRLATILAGKADTADALAAEHAMARNMDDWAKEVARAKSARHFVGVLDDAVKRLAEKQRRTGFVRPSWEEVVALACEKCPAWPAEDVRGWYDHFETVGWRVGGSGGKPMANWQAALGNGFRNWQRNPKSSAPKKPAPVYQESDTNRDIRELAEKWEREQKAKQAAEKAQSK